VVHGLNACAKAKGGFPSTVAPRYKTLLHLKQSFVKDQKHCASRIGAKFFHSRAFALIRGSKFYFVGE